MEDCEIGLYTTFIPFLGKQALAPRIKRQEASGRRNKDGKCRATPGSGGYRLHLCVRDRTESLPMKDRDKLREALRARSISESAAPEDSGETPRFKGYKIVKASLTGPASNSIVTM